MAINDLRESWSDRLYGSLKIPDVEFIGMIMSVNVAFESLSAASDTAKGEIQRLQDAIMAGVMVPEDPMLSNGKPIMAVSSLSSTNVFDELYAQLPLATQQSEEYKEFQRWKEERQKEKAAQKVAPLAAPAQRLIDVE